MKKEEEEGEDREENNESRPRSSSIQYSQTSASKVIR